jgi:hypothetical protein
VVPLRSIEAHLGERRYSSYSFLISARWVVSVRPRPRFTPGETAHGTHCTGGWVGLRAGPDADCRGKFFCLWRGSNPVGPVRSQTLYWLSYPGSTKYDVEQAKETKDRKFNSSVSEDCMRPAQPLGFPVSKRRKDNPTWGGISYIKCYKWNKWSTAADRPRLCVITPIQRTAA